MKMDCKHKQFSYSMSRLNDRNELLIMWEILILVWTFYEITLFSNNYVLLKDLVTAWPSYEITLFSNHVYRYQITELAWPSYEITLFSNSVPKIWEHGRAWPSYEITLFSNLNFRTTPLYACFFKDDLFIFSISYINPYLPQIFSPHPEFDNQNTL